MKQIWFITGVLLMHVFSLSVLGQELVTDRPDQTESSNTIPQGCLQVEMGLLLEQNESYDLQGLYSADRYFSAPSTLLRYGLLKGVELRMLSQLNNFKLNISNDVKATFDFSDLEVGTKVQLLDREDVKTKIAFLSHLVIPTGTRMFSNIKYGSINKLAIAHPLTPNVDWGINIGYDYLGTSKGSLTQSMAIGVGVSERFGFFLEEYGDWENFDAYMVNFDAGMTYLLKEHFQLDFSFGTGVNHSMNFLGFGFSWLIANNQ